MTSPRLVPRPPRSTSEWALIAANVVPILGILLLGWSVGELAYVYWLESAIIGLFNVAKLIRVGGLLAIPLSVFFSFHYGMFMFVHLAFLNQLVPVGDHTPFMPDMTQIGLILWDYWFATGALVVSHGLSFKRNFIDGREHEGREVGKQMFAPYPRIFAMHITILVGAWFILLFDVPDAMGVLLVVLKTGVDLAAHQREHARAEA